jgi:methylase of polypeptide subunit release factors
LERQFVVHRVLEGEGFISIAATYNTNEDAIRAVNYALGDSLWADTVLVIPLGQTDISGIPPMSVFLVSDEGMTIEALALEQNVDAALLRELNALPEGYILHQGEWVLIPHEMTIP